MDFTSIPPRPRSDGVQRVYEFVLFSLLFLIPCYFMECGVSSVFAEDTLLKRLVSGLTGFYCFYISLKTVDSIDKKHDASVNAWHNYWYAYYEKESSLVLQLDEVDCESDPEKYNDLQLALKRHRGIRERYERNRR